jgi:hypothetical protein
MHRLVRPTATALLPVLAVLALAGCGGDDTSSAGGTPTSAATTTASPSGPRTPSNTADASRDEADVVITATVANGKITPSTQTVKASQGQTVKITVTSDEADEIHLHGYDKEIPLEPGKPGSVTFTADTKGTFEIETHESGKLVAKLVVN